MLAQRALDAVCGVDVNPFAVAIARFRLIVAAMQPCGVRRLDKAPGWSVHVAFGDSLMHGDTLRPARVPPSSGCRSPSRGPTRSTPSRTRPGSTRSSSRQYHAVVGNPPYITVKDAALNERYRSAGQTCHRQVLARRAVHRAVLRLALAADERPTGRLSSGMITANSFMKREFGKKLIEEFFPTVDLTHVIDTSGAYIPGHGTPTVILFGRNRGRSATRSAPCWASGASRARPTTRRRGWCGGDRRSTRQRSDAERVRQRDNMPSEHFRKASLEHGRRRRAEM